MTTSTYLDATAFKAATREQWDRSAQGWNDNAGLIRAWLHLSTDAMLAMGAEFDKQQVMNQLKSYYAKAA